MTNLPLPVTAWLAEGKDSTPSEVTLRPAIPPHLTARFPMPSGREARHMSYGAAFLFDDDRTSLKVLAYAVPVEARFDFAGLRAAAEESAGKSPIAASPMDSVRCRTTEFAPGDARGRLRRLTLIVDPASLSASFARRWRMPRAPCVITHHHVRHLGFPAIIRVLSTTLPPTPHEP